MKRFIAIFLMLIVVATATWGQKAVQAAKEKSEAELLIKQAARIKSPQINYAYISFGMLKQMLSPMIERNSVVTEFFGSIKSLRRFFTTGPEGKKKLAAVMQPFMQEEEEVMGMELMTINREDGMMSAIYAGGDNILVVNDSGECLSVVFLVGLSYDGFNVIFGGNFVDVDFGF